MRFQRLNICVLALPLLCLAVTAGDKANFNGQWVMDPNKSEGLPPGMKQNMKVEQTGDQIAIETELLQGDNVQTVPDNYMLDGKEVEIPVRLNSGEETKAKRVSKWNETGDGFEARDVAVFDTPDGKVTITTVRKWALAADGKSLVIELTRTGPNGANTAKRTFTRK